VEFHVHTNASLLVVGTMLFRNLTRKSDQLVVYTYRLLKRAKNYSITEKEALTMVFVLDKFKHYLLGNKLVFCVDHMTLVYLVNKPQVLRGVANRFSWNFINVVLQLYLWGGNICLRVLDIVCGSENFEMFLPIGVN